MNYCEGKVCGADYDTNEFCGAGCEAGMGCDADGQCGAWPPMLDSIYNGLEEWQLPPCSVNDDPGAAFEGAADAYWVKTMTTTGGDCGPAIKMYHPMATVGSVATEDTSVPAFGSCLMYSDGQWGTARDGYAVWGQSWPDIFGQIEYMISWRAIIDHNLPTPTGKGVAHITRLGEALDCNIEFDVTYEKCPDHRSDCGGHPKPW